MKLKSLLIAAACGLLTLVTCNTADAEEGGSGHYMVGSMSSFVDGVPAHETFIIRYNLLSYDGSIGLGEPLPIAGVQTLGAETSCSPFPTTAICRTDRCSTT